MDYIILSLFALAGIIIGIYLYGDSQIKQMQSGGFFGIALGCILIMIFAL